MANIWLNNSAQQTQTSSAAKEQKKSELWANLMIAGTDVSIAGISFDGIKPTAGSSEFAQVRNTALEVIMAKFDELKPGEVLDVPPEFIRLQLRKADLDASPSTNDDVKAKILALWG